MERQHESEHLAVAPEQGRGDHGEGSEDCGIDGRVELRRMQGNAASVRGRIMPGWARARRKPHSPGQVAGAAVAAAVEEAADSSDRQADEQPGGDAVGQPHQREFSPGCKPPGCEGGRGQRPEDDQPAAGDVDDGSQRLGQAHRWAKKLRAVFEHVEQPGADKAPQKNLRTERENRVGVEARSAAADDRQPGARGRRHQEHHAVASDRHPGTVVERRQDPQQHRSDDQDRHPKRPAGRPEAVPRCRPREARAPQHRPDGQPESPAEQRHAAAAQFERRGDVKQRRPHRDSDQPPLRDGSR